MQEEIKCPNVEEINLVIVEIIHINVCIVEATFSTKKPEEVKPHETKKQANPSSNVTVNVNVDNPRQQKSQK